MEEKLYHIGRDNNKNEIFINDDSISLSHAQVYLDKNIDLIIIDLSSKNGVFINNYKIDSPFKLSDSDLIRLGNISFKKEDLLTAIKTYESSDFKSNISLIPKNKNDFPKNSHSNKKTNKLIYLLLIILAIVISLLVGYFIFNQQEIEKKIINDKSETIINRIEEGVEILLENPREKDNINKVENTKQRTDLVYNFSCLSNEDDQGTGELILEFGDITKNVQNELLNEIKISLKEEEEEGEKFIRSLKNDGLDFIENGADLSRLNNIMRDLISQLSNPRGFNYKIYLANDDIKNVYTIGGKIVFYKGMLDFCKSDSEIAALISHEIAHNELGHSILALKKAKASSKFGIFGELALIFEDATSASFNQKEEAQADMFGLDLLIPLNYKECASIDLLKRISDNENEFNLVDNLFRSHPYSINRIKCLENHLNNNYNKKCN